MKLTRLTLAGFGPYKDEQSVDFTRFDDDGIFLITGKTGAGKSSILDAVCFALYGSVPRYDGAQARLRSDHAGLTDPTFVELEFTVAGIDYRVRRTPEFERQKRGGNGTTKQAHEATLARFEGGEWRGVAAKPVDVGHELAGVLLLSKEQFLQVILLAQNRFHEFLLAKNDDRQGVLRTLFGTQRFLQLEERLAAREKAMAGTIAGAGAQLARHAQAVAELGGGPVSSSPDGAWFAASLAAADRAANDLAGAATAATDLFVAADLAFAALLERDGIQKRRTAAQLLLDALLAQEKTASTERQALDAARRASRVWPLALAWESAIEAESRAESAKRAAAEAYVDGSAGAGASDNADASPSADAENTVAVISATLGTLAETLSSEARLPALAVELAQRAEIRAETDATVETLDARAAELPVLLDRVNADIVAARLASAELTPIDEQRSRLDLALTAATRAAALGGEVAAARVSEATQISAHAASANDLNTAVRARLNGHAAELAGELVAGAPCIVCGSREHPEPAASDADRVTERDVERARTAVSDRWHLVETASSTLTAKTIMLAESLAQAGGRDSDDLAGALAVLERERDNAATAAATLPGLEGRRESLQTELTDAARTLQNLQSARAAEIAEHASLSTVRDEILARVALHRAEFATVGDRVDHLVRVHSVATAFISARNTLAAAHQGVASAFEFLDIEREARAFADIAEARGARLADGEMARLESSVQTYDQSVSNARAVLAETADAGGTANAAGAVEASASASVVDVEAGRASRASLSDHRDAALNAHFAATARAEQIRTEVISAKALLANLGDAVTEYEQLRQLAGVVQGGEANELRMRLESFVLAAQLEEIVIAANRRLKTMTGGRFTLEHDDGIQYRKARSGLNLAIRDQHTGRSRAPHSLSGGETFLASLALALGLAEVVTNQTGGIRLDTLFVDEGFGSLDSDTLEIAMTTLESLRAGGRTIGLISHVDAMKEQIAAKLHISVTAQGYSVIVPPPGTKIG